MRLIDFSLVPEFRGLLQKMGVREVIQVDGAEWRDWDGFGIDVDDVERIVENADGTLSFEGRRVLVYIRDQTLRKGGELGEYRFHVAECQTLINMRKANRFARYVVTTRVDGRFVVNLFEWGVKEPVRPKEELALKVCKHCLRRLNWRGYENAKGPQRAVLWKAFQPDLFMEQYGTFISTLPREDADSARLQQYPEHWSDLTDQVRATSSWRCRDCGKCFEASWHRRFLHTHHIDGDKGNSARSNLRALCIGCHVKQPAHAHLKNSPDHWDFQLLDGQGAFRCPPGDSGAKSRTMSR